MEQSLQKKLKSGDIIQLINVYPIITEWRGEMFVYDSVKPTYPLSIRDRNNSYVPIEHVEDFIIRSGKIIK